MASTARRLFIATEIQRPAGAARFRGLSLTYNPPMALRLPLAVAGVILAAAVSSCSVTSSGDAPRAGERKAAVPSTEPVAPDCDETVLRSSVDGHLTWGARLPGSAPWVTGGSPAEGKGFEAAVAAEVTRRLGFRPDETIWLPVTWDEILAPGPKTFDIAFDQIIITPDRGTVVDFSLPYYSVRQAVVVLEGNPATRSVRTLDDLRSLRLGARRDSAAMVAITSLVAPTTSPSTFAPGSDDGVNALRSGQIDGLVVDVPRAYFLTTVALDGTRIAGTMPQASDEPDEFGLVLEKHSPLTPCVDAVVAAMRNDGILDALEETWLANENAPDLK